MSMSLLQSISSSAMQRSLVKVVSAPNINSINKFGTLIVEYMQGFLIRRRSAVDIMKIMTMCGVGIRER